MQKGDLRATKFAKQSQLQLRLPIDIPIPILCTANAHLPKPCNPISNSLIVKMYYIIYGNKLSKFQNTTSNRLNMW